VNGVYTLQHGYLSSMLNSYEGWKGRLEVVPLEHYFLIDNHQLTSILSEASITNKAKAYKLLNINQQAKI